ncbi:DUF1685 domain-containing protein [Cephalotus follicularis]|uniref:DUF1685 domain-containing protein n=1 Tax=Cephalotus follicularis TaxID=3775 RepID=A0A1Q3CBI2_CEPFO|nr:DUF1685 domain-containing protein [Cephalotus follicularis]
MSRPKNAVPIPPPQRLYKQHSWSPDADRDEAWIRRRQNKRNSDGVGLSRSKSVTDEDLEELKGCIELGFGFALDSPELDPKLSQTLPALGFYCAVNKQFSERLSRSSSCSSMGSECESGNNNSIFDQGDDKEMVKVRLKQWAQVVACSVRQNSGEPN